MITVQATRVMRAHPDLTDEVAAQVEPATVAFHGVRRSGITPGDTVGVQGAGPIGRSGGMVQLLSFLSEPATINAGRWLAKQVTVVASNAFTHDDFRRSMTFLADGRVRAQPLHTRTVRLDELEATLSGLSAGPSDDVKVLVDPR